MSEDYSLTISALNMLTVSLNHITFFNGQIYD